MHHHESMLSAEPTEEAFKGAMIREMTRPDFASFWPTFSAIIKAEETYALDPDMTQQEAFSLWCESTLEAYALVENDVVLGIYYLKSNGMGPSRHICNCGYMVANEARGRGIARLLCEHSQERAIAFGFQAMQFNSVVSINEVAVTLWQKLGFSIVGTIPKAYKHSRLGLVDS